jgi:putative hydrolase of the HAD superfamily
VLTKEGFKKKIIIDEFEKIDAKNIQEQGFSPYRYGRSMTKTYLFLCSKFNHSVQEKTLVFLNEVCSRKVVDTVPEILEGAIEFLEWAYSRFYLVVLTRGEEKVQHRKLQESNLLKYFREIYVVPYKNLQIFRSTLAKTGFQPDKTWVIGDSIKSDINPGILLGAKCILYNYKHHSYSWIQEHDSEPIGEFYKVDNLIEIKYLIEF